MRPCFFPTESFKGSTAKRPFTSRSVEVVDKGKGVDGKRASGWSWSYYRGSFVQAARPFVCGMDIGWSNNPKRCYVRCTLD